MHFCSENEEFFGKIVGPQMRSLLDIKEIVASLGLSPNVISTAI
jgi:hypothetical protein